MKRWIVACAALPLLFACTPRGGNAQASSSAVTPSAAPVTPAAPTSTPMTVQEAAQRFGLIGMWSVDCNQPASPDNTHDTYALESDGSVSLVYDAGPSMQQNRYSWTQGNIIQPDEIQMDGVFLGDGVAQHTVLQKNDAGQVRVFGNVDGTGKILVQNGAFPHGGAPPWSNKCSS